MKKLKMHTSNLIDDNITKIRDLFPSCITEARDEKGNVRYAVDFDQLRQELSDHIVEGPQERYHFNWPGKREALLTANAPLGKTLRPCREESVNFETTKNIFIEGDNLEALKLLQKTYLGKIKMIYIDPPYNTGNNFIYEDDFSEDRKDFLLRSKQVDVFGNRLVANTEVNGRLHSDWLSMIYSRLYLARNLLAENGVILISIDDNEQHNLRKICDEVFGEENFVNCITVKLSEATGVKMLHAKSRFPKTKEYILLYSRGGSISINPIQTPLEKWNDEYKEMIIGMTQKDLEQVKELIYQDIATQEDVLRLNAIVKDAEIVTLSQYFRDENIITEDQKIAFKWKNAWRIVQTVGAESLRKRAVNARVDDQMLSSVLSFKGKLSLFKTNFNDNTRDPRIRILFADKYLHYNPGDFWADIKTAGGVALEGDIPFPNGKKPLKLIKRIIKALTCAHENDIVMDFFAGSGTTMHAVLALNSKDGGNRTCISVQRREKIDEKSEAYKDGLHFVSDICKERIRRAGKKVLESECHPDWNKDIGFQVFKIAPS